MRRTFGLVFELVARTAETGAHRVAALNHEVGDDAMENGSVVEGIAGLFARCGMRPLALAFGEVDEVGDRLGGVLLKQAAHDGALAGFEHGISSGCAGHSVSSNSLMFCKDEACLVSDAGQAASLQEV